jgi:hypothetical protein
MPEYQLSIGGAVAKWRRLDAFTRAYVESAMWTMTDDDGNPCDDLGLVDIADETIARMVDDCRRFQEANRGTLERAGDDEQNGHDFNLTRNGHGAGFWDRGYDDAIGDALTDAAHAFGTFDLYIGDDGFVHGM